MSTSSFPETRWSVVAAAGTAHGDPTRAHAALAELCGLYWYPLYAYARRRGLDPEDAEDGTQAFFAGLLEADLFSVADPSIGRLRSFLLTAFTRDLADARRRAGRQKRGGGVEIVSLDREVAEGRFLAAEPDGEASRTFETAWAVTVLESALLRVESDYRASGRAALFTSLRPCLGAGLAGDAGEAGPSLSAASTGLSEVALRQAVSRLRERFRKALRAQVADTLRDPTETAIDDELRSLRAVLSAAR